MNLQPVERQSVSDAVFAQLQGEILSGRLAPGEALPSERTLTELTGVNRQAVREALKRLHQAGLVDIAHGGSTRVRDFRTSASLDLLESLLVADDGSIDLTVVRSIMEMRACVGPDAARLCALRALPATTDAIDAVVDAMEAADADGDGVRVGELDWEFWGLVIDGADNVAYRLAYNSMRVAAAPLTELLPVVVGDELADIEGHRRLADAIVAADPTAADAAARALLARGVAAFTSVMAVQEP